MGSRNNEEFAPIGELVVAVSRLEYALDDFLFRFSSRHKDTAESLTKTYPFKIKERIDLVISVLICEPGLRTQPIFSDGFLDLNWLAFALEELFNERNHIAHGASFFHEVDADRTVYHFYRYTRVSKNAYERVQYSISNYGLEHLSKRAHVLRRYFDRLSDYMEGGEGWEQHYKAQAESSDNWRMLAQLGIAQKHPETGKLFIPAGKLNHHACN